MPLPLGKAMLDRRPVGHAGVSHAGIWGRVFQAEVAAQGEGAGWLNRVSRQSG